MIYLDSSAIVKLVREESGSVALRTWMADNPRPLVTSALARTETARALARNEPAALPVLRMVLALLHQVPITDSVLDAASAFPDVHLRSLDAIHLATAGSLSSVLTWFVAYDKRLAEAARSQGLSVVSPSQ